MVLLLCAVNALVSVWGLLWLGSAGMVALSFLLYVAGAAVVARLEDPWDARWGRLSLRTAGALLSVGLLVDARYWSVLLLFEANRAWWRVSEQFGVAAALWVSFVAAVWAPPTACAAFTSVIIGAVGVFWWRFSESEKGCFVCDEHRGAWAIAACLVAAAAALIAVPRSRPTGVVAAQALAALFLCANIAHPETGPLSLLATVCIGVAANAKGLIGFCTWDGGSDTPATRHADA